MYAIDLEKSIWKDASIITPRYDHAFFIDRDKMLNCSKCVNN